MNRIFLFFTFLYLLAIHCHAQQNHAHIEEDFKNLEEIRTVFGDSSKIYYDQLINSTTFYVHDSAYAPFYKEIAGLILQSNHPIRQQYGVDSPQYAQLMSSLTHCLSMKYWNMDDFNHCSPTIIQALQELEPLMGHTQQNTIEFATLLSTVYQLYQPNDSLALYYAQIKYNKTQENYEKESKQYSYAVDNFINSFLRDKQYDKALTYLKARKKETNHDNSPYQFLIESSLSLIHKEAPLSFIKYLINELSPTIHDENFHLIFYSNAALENNLEALHYYEKNYIHQIKDFHFTFKFYYEAGWDLVYSSVNLPLGIDYLLKGEEIFLQHGMNDTNNYPVSVSEGTLHNIFQRLSNSYKLTEQYDKAALSIVDAANYIRKNFKDQQTVVDECLNFSALFMKLYYEKVKGAAICYPLIANYLDAFKSAGGTLKQLSLLCHCLAENFDFDYCNLIEDKIVRAEKDDYTLYDYYLLVACYKENKKLYAEAIPYYEKAIYYADKLANTDLLYLHADDGSKSHYAHNLAHCYTQSNQPTKAIEWYERAVQDIKQQLGSDSKEYFEPMQIYITLLTEMKCYDKAAFYLNEAITSAKHLYGKTTHYYEYLKWHITLLIGQQAYEKGVYYLDEAIALSRTFYGEKSEEFCENVLDKIQCMTYTGAFHETLAFIQEVRNQYPWNEEKLSRLAAAHIYSLGQTAQFESLITELKKYTSLLTNNQTKGSIIQITAHCVKEANSEELTKELLGIIDGHIEKLSQEEPTSPKLICDFCHSIANVYQYRDSEITQKYLRKELEYLPVDAYAEKFLTQSMLTNQLFPDFREIERYLKSNENILKRHLSNRKDLFYQLQRDWGDYYYKMFNKERAYSYFDKCYDYYCNDKVDINQRVDFMFSYATNLTVDKRYPKALTVYQKLNESYLSTTNYDLNLQLYINGCIIECYLELQQITDAKNSYHTYLSLLPGEQALQDFGAHFYKGLILHAQQKDEEAITCFTEAANYIRTQNDHYKLTQIMKKLRKHAVQP